MSDKKKKRRIRNTAKAVIIQNDKILLQECDFGDHIKCYLLPGGGQKFGETLKQTLKRECKEELGAKVEAGDLIWTREYISANHEFADEGDAHNVEFYFKCSLKTTPDETKALKPDKVQVGIQWIDLSDIAHINIYPKSIIPVLQTLEFNKYPLYAGDVN